MWNKLLDSITLLKILRDFYVLGHMEDSSCEDAYNTIPAFKELIAVETTTQKC